MVIKVNEDYLKENYKEIQKFCFSNGSLMPLLINRESDDDYIGYRFDDSEKKPYFDNMDIVAMGKLEKSTVNRRADMHLIIQKIHPTYDDLNSYMEDELKEWCRENFQFKGVYNQI